MILYIASLGIGCASNPAATSSPGTGTLTVTVVAEPNPLLPRTASGVDSYGGLENAPRQLTPVDYAHLDGIVVWLEPINRKSSAGDPVALALKDWTSESEPQVRGVNVGSQVTIENNSRQPQSIFSYSRGNEFDLGRLPPGGRGTFSVRARGEIEILTESVSEPVAILFAVPSALVRETTAEKPVRFTNLAPGEYRVSCWTSRLPGSSSSVQIQADRESSASLKTGVTQLPRK